MSDYTGGLNNHVFAFLDSLHPAEKTYHAPELPEPKSNIGKECLAYIKELYNLNNSKEKDILEREFITKMRKRYPNLDWIAGRTENRGI
jgi:hypothetical protein